MISKAPEFSSGPVGKQSVIADEWQNALGAFIKARKAGSSPPGFTDGPFRKIGTQMIMHMTNLTHSAYSMHAALSSTGTRMTEFMIEDLTQAEEAMGKWSGGHGKKFKVWKDDLGAECSVEVLKERYNHALNKCNGAEIKTKGKELDARLKALQAHIDLLLLLSNDLGESAQRQCKAVLDKGKGTFSQAQASKLEYWVCHLYFDDKKEKQDKRDQLLHYSAQFDSHDLEGGRGAWVHNTVMKLEKAIMAYGAAAPGGGTAPGQKQKKI